MNFLLENEKFYNPTNHCVSVPSDGAGSDQGMVTRECWEPGPGQGEERGRLLHQSVFIMLNVKNKRKNRIRLEAGDIVVYLILQLSTSLTLTTRSSSCQL